jgi:GcrA cell cycle regulator
MTAGSEWTDLRVALLTKLWADGLTASQIAAELGGFPNCADNGRSAVIGKVHRLGLSGRTKPKSTKSDKRTQGSKVRRINYNRSGSPGLPPPTLDYGPTIGDLEIPLEQRRTLIQLTAQTCKWPVGDPGSVEFFFCGAATDEEPYCSHHYRRAHDRGND